VDESQKNPRKAKRFRGEGAKKRKDSRTKGGGVRKKKGKKSEKATLTKR